jgi:hypothetical protein
MDAYAASRLEFRITNSTRRVLFTMGELPSVTVDKHANLSLARLALFRRLCPGLGRDPLERGWLDRSRSVVRRPRDTARNSLELLADKLGRI